MSEEIEKFSFSTLNETKDRHISGLKVVVTVGERDSPVFVNESREYAQVRNYILLKILFNIYIYIYIHVTIFHNLYKQ